MDTSKTITSPEVIYDYDHNHESLQVTIELPGVKPDEYDLKMASCGFRIQANTTNTLFKGCYSFYHEVDADAATVELSEGVLLIKVPFFTPLCGKQPPIDIDL